MDTKSQQENKEEGDEKKDGDDKGDGEESNGEDGKASAKSDGSKKDEAAPAKPTGKKLPPVQSIAEKRAMERIFLTKEAREYKEKLLDYVNEIVVR